MPVNGNVTLNAALEEKMFANDSPGTCDTCGARCGQECVRLCRLPPTFVITIMRGQVGLCCFLAPSNRSCPYDRVPCKMLQVLNLPVPMSCRHTACTAFACILQSSVNAKQHQYINTRPFKLLTTTSQHLTHNSLLQHLRVIVIHTKQVCSV